MSKEIFVKSKGITLIILVITIIILLILAGVALSLVVGEEGIVKRASDAKQITETAELQEKIKIAAMAAQVDGLGTIDSIETLKNELNSAIGTDYEIETNESGWNVIVNKKAFSIDTNAKVEEKSYFDKEEWDKTAADEDCFYWASDDESTEGYDTIIGYTSKLSTYTLLRFPSRCKKIEMDKSLLDSGTYQGDMAVRAYTKNITKVELPENILVIGQYAFGEYNFESMQKINIPNSVTMIGSYSFLGCKSLTKVVIPNGVISIGWAAFQGCKGLTEITVPSSVKFIDCFTFRECSNLRKIFIPKEVIEICSEDDISAFFSCSSALQIYTDAPEDMPGWREKWHSHFDFNYNVNYNISLEQYNSL